VIGLELESVGSAPSSPSQASSVFWSGTLGIMDYPFAPTRSGPLVASLRWGVGTGLFIYLLPAALFPAQLGSSMTSSMAVGVPFTNRLSPMLKPRVSALIVPEPRAATTPF
jgi:hypothetical protein